MFKMDFTTFDKQTLSQMVVNAYTRWTTETDDAKKSALKLEIEEMNDAMKTLVDTKPDIADFSGRSDMTTKIKQMTLSLDNIPKFNPGCEVELFIQRLDNCFKIFCTGENKSKMETHFLHTAQTRLGDTYLTSLIQSEETMSTFEEFKTYLLINYQSKRTIYQSMDSLFEIKGAAGESYRDVAARLTQKAHHVLLSLRAANKKLNPNENVIPDSTLLNMMCSQMFLNDIRNNPKARLTFNFIANDLDGCLTPMDVANKAEAVAVRLKKEDDIDVPQSFRANIEKSYTENVSDKSEMTSSNDDRKKRQRSNDCFLWLRGECKRENCLYQHNPDKKGSKPRQENTPDQPEQSTTMMTLPEADFLG